MNSNFVNILFLIFTIFVLIRTISYGIYEIKKEKNLTGGITIFIISIASIIFSNIMIWIR